MEITVAGAAPRDMHAAIEAAFGAVAKVHGLMSFHDANSDVGRLNNGGWVRPLRVHRWTFQVLEAAVDLHRRSASTATTEAIELLSDRRVRFRHPGVRIDLGGIAKGFAVDRAIDVLRDHRMLAGLVNAGGDLAAFGPATETVYIRDPRDPRRLMCGIEIDNQALASSGNRFDPFRSASPSGPAIIDPRTRQAVRSVNAVTVRAPSCLIADALTKVVMAEGPSAADLLDHYRAGALVVSAAGAVQMTEDLQGAVCLAA